MLFTQNIMCSFRVGFFEKKLQFEKITTKLRRNYIETT